MRRANPKVIIGIDPGTDGIICIYQPELDSVKFEKLPYTGSYIDIEKLEWIFDCYNIGKIVTERPFITPGKNQGLINQIMNYGILWTVSNQNCMDVVEVTPNQWKSKFKVTKDKQSSINKVKELDSTIELKMSSRCRVDNHDMAEAYLMARYGNLPNV